MKKQATRGALVAFVFTVISALVVATPSWAVAIDAPSNREFTDASMPSGSYGIGVDANGLVFQSDFAGDKVNVYPANATGTTAPLRTISGGLTGLDGPGGIAFGPNGELIVTSYLANKVLVFASGASGNVAPIHEVATTTIYPQGLSLNSTSGKLAVGGHRGVVIINNPLVDTSPSMILSDNALTDMNYGVAWDNLGGLYSSKAGYSTVVYMSPGFAAGDAPTRSFQTSNMPWGLVFDSNDNTLLVQELSVIYRYSATASGSATALESITSTDAPFQTPYGITMVGCDFYAGNVGNSPSIAVYQLSSTCGSNSGSLSSGSNSAGSSSANALADTGANWVPIGVTGATITIAGLAVVASRRVRRSSQS